MMCDGNASAYETVKQHYVQRQQTDLAEKETTISKNKDTATNVLGGAALTTIFDNQGRRGLIDFFRECEGLYDYSLNPIYLIIVLIKRYLYRLIWNPG
ncbi:unnamed protein product [Rotaria sp. Silwood1]|nr:unnamed protein product [Rotaria sp. Silwood1]